MSAIVESGDSTVGERFGKDECASREWLQRVTGITVKDAVVVPLNDTGGASGSGIFKVEMVAEDGQQHSLILKIREPNHTGASVGLAREAYFYTYFGPRVTSIIPKVLYSYGIFATGEKALLMENLSDCIQTGYFFGKHSPHNLKKDLTSICGYEDHSAERVAAMEVISEHAFEFAGRIGATYWNDRSLLDTTWVRGNDWLRGQGEDTWLAAQGNAITGWKATKAKVAAAVTDEDKAKLVKWDPLLWSIIDASIGKTSWTDYQREVQAPGCHFTLVHGDFHPANMMWRRNAEAHANGKEEGKLILLDWEVVGVGCGAQDCAQFVISHMRPDERRKCENRLLHTYYDALIRGGVRSVDYSFDQCYRDYVNCGIGRWVWLITLCTLFMDASWIQYFHDQMLEFVKDHNVTPESVPMPRV
jgi:hypothetical protein